VNFCLDADGATAPETLRQKDRDVGDDLERGTVGAHRRGFRLAYQRMRMKLSGTVTDGACRPFRNGLRVSVNGSLNT
jgi:hypothetical protein